MKNKKFLLTIAMIMSLVMAVSCGDTPTDSTTGDKKPGTDQPTGDKDLGTLVVGKGAKTTPLAIAVNTATATETEIKGQAKSTEAFTVTGLAEGVTPVYKIKSIATDKMVAGATENDSNVENAGFPKNGTGFSIGTGGDLNKIIIADKTTVGGKSAWAANKHAGLAVTIEVSAEGYKTQEIVVYIKATMGNREAV